MIGAATLGEHSYKPPVAAWRHTALLTVILLGIAARGAMFQAAPASAAAPVHNPLPLYLSLLIGELLLVYAVWAGMRRTGTTLAGLIGGRWKTARDVLFDVLPGIAVWVLLTAIAGAWDRWAPLAGQARSISPLLPQGPVETAVWIALSLVAGVAEEIVFRGYFQRQLEALTQSRWAALALQAALFGVSHGYQGVRACLKITVIGGLLGLVGVWRHSLRPGMIAHAWTDIASGLFRI